jgi:V8-like Glu-specific endopeptidase
LAAVALGTAPANASLSQTAAASTRAKASGVTSNLAPSLTPDARRHQTGKGAEAQRAALSTYWNADRMETAIDADDQPGLAAAATKTAKASKQRFAKLKTGPRPARPTQSQAIKVAPKPPKGESLTGIRAASWTPGYAASAPVARTYGKVFFTNTTNHLNYVCSATVVNSEGRDTVWTAGHCVHGGSGGSWHANWAFVPAYSYGTAPYGVWSAVQLWSRGAWTGSSDFTQDMGVAILGLRNGQHIVNVVGGQGIAWNYSKNYYAYDFGYPQGAPFDGGKLIACAGTTAPEWSFGPWSANTIKLNCDMTGGSSGGAWLRWFDGNWGYINGLNSYKYDNDPNTMYSPYFSDAAASLYNAVRNL